MEVKLSSTLYSTFRNTHFRLRKRISNAIAIQSPSKPSFNWHAETQIVQIKKILGNGALPNFNFSSLLSVVLLKDIRLSDSHFDRKAYWPFLLFKSIKWVNSTSSDLHVWNTFASPSYQFILLSQPLGKNVWIEVERLITLINRKELDIMDKNFSVIQRANHEK